MSTRRTVVHHAQLTDLPEGTILMDRMGLPVWNTDHAGWRSANGGRNIDVQLLIKDGAPFVILYQPAAEHHEPPNADAPSDVEIDAAARAMFETRDDPYDDTEWGELTSADRERWECYARAALVAAREAAGR